jgi:hypothetical protein
MAQEFKGYDFYLVSGPDENELMLASYTGKQAYFKNSSGAEVYLTVTALKRAENVKQMFRISGLVFAGPWEMKFSGYYDTKKRRGYIVW